MQDPAPHTFVAESRELIRAMESALLTLEQSPRDTEAVNAVFRAMHTIKGSAGVFGFDAIVQFTHVMEGLIEEIRTGSLVVDEVLVALLLTCGDHVTSLIDCLETEDRMARLEAVRPEGADLLQQLSCYGAMAEVRDPARETREIDSAPASGRGAVASGAWHVSARFSPDVLQHGMDPLSFIRYLSTLGEVTSVAALFDAMPEAQAMDPQACYVGLEIQFSSTVTRQDIEDAFEYVRDDSTIRILPPHASLSAYADLLRVLPEAPAKLGQCLVDCGALTPGELAQALQMVESTVMPIADTPQPGQAPRLPPGGTAANSGRGAPEPARATRIATTATCACTRTSSMN